MKRALFMLLVLASLLSPQDKKRKPKPAEVQVLSASAHRMQGTIVLDGKVKNAGERPVEKLILLFDFMAAGRQVITTQKGPAESERLDPGQETEFRLEMNDAVRAVEFRIQAEDGDGRELTVRKNGPFPIE